MEGMSQDRPRSGPDRFAMSRGEGGGGGSGGGAWSEARLPSYESARIKFPSAEEATLPHPRAAGASVFLHVAPESVEIWTSWPKLATHCRPSAVEASESATSFVGALVSAQVAPKSSER